MPVAYGHRDVWVRGYVDQVVIGCRGEVIAWHPQCYAGEEMIFDPIHYLPLLEKKSEPLMRHWFKHNGERPGSGRPLGGLGPAS